MEIGLFRKGGLQVLTLKGAIRRQNWKVVERHLESLLEKGCRILVLDMGEAAFIDKAGVAALPGKVKEFRNRQARLMLVSADPDVRGLLAELAGPLFPAENVFSDWPALEKRLEHPV